MEKENGIADMNWDFLTLYISYTLKANLKYEETFKTFLENTPTEV